MDAAEQLLVLHHATEATAAPTDGCADAPARADADSCPDAYRYCAPQSRAEADRHCGPHPFTDPDGCADSPAFTDGYCGAHPNASAPADGYCGPHPPAAAHPNGYCSAHYSPALAHCSPVPAHPPAHPDCEDLLVSVDRRDPDVAVGAVAVGVDCPL
ncbi:hypothetical protein [Candidatus Poriferisocius sp.]|uniref:hypothetical protein n=1 Tax=Candidatus Poriferisocius sp. TaxID=3101276 RepID=UPI003B014346